MEITLEHLSKSYGGKRVLEDLSLTVASHSFTTLLGPSGCGKTTLLRMIAGLETPDAGRILFDGVPVFDAYRSICVPPERRGLSFVFQDFALWPHLDVFENVAFGLRAQGRTEQLDEKVRKALAAVHLGGYERRRIGALSGGQQQRVAFARAIVTEPRCILFDEPLSALDAVLRIEMRREITSLVHETGTTALFVTHDQEEAMSMSDAIAVLSAGHLEQFATPEELYRRPRTPFGARFVGASNWLGAHALFRPERAHLTAAPGDTAYPARVELCQFAGARYDVTLRHADALWHLSTDTPLAPGASVTLYVPKDAIITC